MPTATSRRRWTRIDHGRVRGLPSLAFGVVVSAPIIVITILVLSVFHPIIGALAGLMLVGWGLGKLGQYWRGTLAGPCPTCGKQWNARNLPGLSFRCDHCFTPIGVTDDAHFVALGPGARTEGGAPSPSPAIAP